MDPGGAFFDLDALVARFESGGLTKAEWTHQAHLLVGLWHVDRFGPREALPLLRTRIRRLNDRHGTANTTTSGYHETITAAYVTLLAQFLASRAPEESLADRAVALTGSRLADRQALLRFYSRDRLMSSDARAAWVEPDLAPLEWPRVADIE